MSVSVKSLEQKQREEAAQRKAAETLRQVMAYFRIKCPELSARSGIPRSTVQSKVDTGKVWTWEADEMAEALGIPVHIFHMAAPEALAWLHENRPNGRKDLPSFSSFRCTAA